MEQAKLPVPTRLITEAVFHAVAPIVIRMKNGRKA